MNTRLCQDEQSYLEYKLQNSISYFQHEKRSDWKDTKFKTLGKYYVSELKELYPDSELLSDPALSLFV